MGHLIKDRSANLARAGKAPVTSSSPAPPSRGRGPRQAASGTSRTARGSTGASNRLANQAPVQVYHVRSSEEYEDLDVVAV
ncbi:hypothetical protein V6N13_125560 [Hibiscus sabdariffa]